MTTSHSIANSSIEYELPLTYKYRAFFTESIFAVENYTLVSCLEATGPARTYFILDSALVETQPHLIEELEAYCAAHSDQILLCGHQILPGGEDLKNDLSFLKKVYQEIDDSKLCRHSYLVAIGGGALLDMIGFAAATAHRGIRHLRLPTTSLSQGDGGVGVKNSINYFNKKNLIGTFAPPFAVINDFRFLQTLPPAQLRDGFIEAVKVGLIRDQAFFDEIEQRVDDLAKSDYKSVCWIVEHSASLHMAHIAKGGDPFELTSARPLDFGHWAAHKLEVISNFEISHGQAVAYGIALDVLYCTKIGALAINDTERILSLIKRLGFNLYTDYLAARSEKGTYVILDGLEEFREHLGGQLTISLLNGIGSSFEVHEMKENMILECIKQLAEHPLSD